MVKYGQRRGCLHHEVALTENPENKNPEYFLSTQPRMKQQARKGTTVGGRAGNRSNCRSTAMAKKKKTGPTVTLCTSHPT